VIRDYYAQTRSPFAELARHFFLSLFHPESTSGEDSFTTWLVQILAVLITASWFLPVQLFRRYSELHALDTAEPYRLAYASDGLSALVLMCLLVGVLTVLEWPALFPSRRDHLVLTPLPLERTQLFGAKLAALLLFVTLFIAAITLCCSVSLPMIASGRWEPRSVWLRMFAWFAASTLACYFVFLSLLAVQGLLMTLLPLRWFEPASFAVQMTLLVALLSGFPLFFYFPASHLIASRSPLLGWLPPAWYWGLSEWMLGSRDPATGQLTERAVLAIAIALVIAATAYLISYLQYNRYALESTRAGRKPRILWVGIFARLFRLPQARGVVEFITCSIARGRQQQTVFLLIFGLGLALIFESSVYVGVRYGQRGFERHSITVESAILAFPLTLSFFALVGLRRAFRAALDLPANWLFRFAESEACRRSQLDAVFRVFVLLGGVPLLLLGVPVEWLAFGSRGLWALPLQFLLMLALAEHLMHDWRGIPFTFASDPARRHLIHSAILHFAELSVYSFAGSTWILAALHSSSALFWFLGIVGSALAVLRYRRLRGWAQEPLEFVEIIPAAVEPLQLA
jgi:hypothetical protein